MCHELTSLVGRRSILGEIRKISERNVLRGRIHVLPMSGASGLNASHRYSAIEQGENTFLALSIQ
jgi:hypothetical protein